MKAKHLLAAAGLSGAAYFGAGTYFYDLAMKRGDKFFLQNNPNLPMGTSGTAEEQADRQAKVSQWVETTPKKNMEMLSFDGLQLKGTAFLQEGGSHGWMIMVHGYMADQKAMYPFAREFYQFGFNILTIDCRGCGSSEGEYTTMGWYDRLDVKEWAEAIVRYDSDSEIVLFGISMGGATVMMTAGEELPENVKCIVEDCGYTSIHDILAFQLKQIFKLPEFPLMNAASTVANLRAGYRLKEASAVRQLAKNKRPIMFIHGDQDAFVPYEMLAEVYAATDAPKESLTVVGAAHGMAYESDPETYVTNVMNFIVKNIL